MSKIFVVKVCKDCPHWTTKRHYTGDSFEMVYYWICSREEKTIASVETFDKDPSIPDWCPLSDLEEEKNGS